MVVDDSREQTTTGLYLGARAGQLEVPLAHKHAWRRIHHTRQRRRGSYQFWTTWPRERTVELGTTLGQRVPVTGARLVLREPFIGAAAVLNEAGARLNDRHVLRHIVVGWGRAPHCRTPG